MMILDFSARPLWTSIAGATVLVMGLGSLQSAHAQYDVAPAESMLSSSPDSTPWPAAELPSGQRPDPAISSESRSTFADKVLAVTRGRVQLEGGYSFVRDDFAGVPRSEHLFPDMLLRVGLTERFEVRLGWGGYLARSHDRDIGGPGNEVLDPTVGFMYDLFPQQGWLPQTAVSAAIPVTLQGNPLTASSFQPLCRVLYLWDLTDRLGIGGTTGMALLRDDGDNFSQVEQTANLDYLLTNRLDVFLEWEMLADFDSVRDASQHLLSTGASFLWTERLQVTWKLGAGMNDPAPDFLTSIRFSIRF